MNSISSRLIKIFILIIILFVFCGDKAWAKNTTEYARAKVVQVTSTDARSVITVNIKEGADKGKKIKINYDNQGLTNLRLKNDDEVVITKEIFGTRTTYSLNDKFRIPYIAIFLALFILLSIFVAGKKGLGAILGVGISLGVIFLYIVPSIISGNDPLLTAILGGILILLPSTYVAHGFSKQTTVALVSTLIALLLTWIISIITVHLSFISGFGAEEATDIHIGIKSIIDFKGLFLAGIIIATLGALNDVTTSQAASVFEIYKSNKNQDFDELLTKGMRVGKEHVTSLINTLVLAFIGSSLAVFIIYFYNPNHTPFWVIINSEIITEEIIRTILGTAGLLLSMPIVTVIATIVCIYNLGEEK